MNSSTRPSQTLRIDLLRDEQGELLDGPRPVAAVVHAASPGATGDPRLPVAGAESTFQDLIEWLYDGAVVVDPDGRVAGGNSRAAQSLGYEPADLRQRRIEDLIRAVDDRLLEQLSTNLLRRQFSLLEARCTRRDGSEFPAEVAVCPLRSGKAYLCFLIRDITVRRESEALSRAALSALRSAGVPIAVTDRAGKVEFANGAFCQLAGRDSPEAVLGQELRSLMVDPTPLEVLSAQALADPQAWISEAVLRRADGDLAAEITAAANVGPHGGITGVVFCFLEANERRRIEAELGEAQSAVAALQEEVERLKCAGR